MLQRGRRTRLACAILMWSILGQSAGHPDRPEPSLNLVGCSADQVPGARAFRTSDDQSCDAIPPTGCDRKYGRSCCVDCGRAAPLGSAGDVSAGAGGLGDCRYRATAQGPSRRAHEAHRVPAAPARDTGGSPLGRGIVRGGDFTRPASYRPCGILTRVSRREGVCWRRRRVGSVAIAVEISFLVIGTLILIAIIYAVAKIIDPF